MTPNRTFIQNPQREKGKFKNKIKNFLNDFYDLLYEKENIITQQGLNPPEYFEREKYHTMGPGIDFPMIMSYKDTENPAFEPYFYFLNGHNDVVYFADSNFTEEQIEDYEYEKGSLPDSSVNSFLLLSLYYDRDLNLIIQNEYFYRVDINRYIINFYRTYNIIIIHLFPINYNFITYSMNMPPFPFGMIILRKPDCIYSIEHEHCQVNPPGCWPVALCILSQGGAGGGCQCRSKE